MSTGMERYNEYLESHSWKIIREKVLIRDKRKCSMCESTLTLQVHHITYKRVGNENLIDLITLCKRCHDEEHKNEKKETNQWHDYIRQNTNIKPNDEEKIYYKIPEDEVKKLQRSRARAEAKKTKTKTQKKKDIVEIIYNADDIWNEINKEGK